MPALIRMGRALLPRRDRRGFIEAGARRRSFSPVPDFRGVIAAASLKRTGGAGHALLLGLPRRDRRGFIEAASIDISPVWNSFDFRGVIAAASLKRWTDRRASFRNQNFRGVIAAASLKRAEPAPVHGKLYKLPRRDRRGFIEATFIENVAPVW